MSWLLPALVGWISVLVWTRWWWWGPHGPYGPNDPTIRFKPQPIPWVILGGVIGAIGGVGAATLLRTQFGDNLAATTITSFAGGQFLGSLAASLIGTGSRVDGANAG